MTNVKRTKRAFFASIMSMILCASMLIGTTFAWFTDTASTGVNTIQAGTLDVELVDAEGNSLEGESLEWVAKDGREQEKIFWEPGCTYYTEPFTFVNNSNLAIQWELLVSGFDGDVKLLEALEIHIYQVVEGEIDTSMDFNGILSAFDVDANAEYFNGAEVADFVIWAHMDEEAGNEYQGLALTGASVILKAWQWTNEHDSIDNQYDKDAVSPIVSNSAFAAALATGGNVVLGSDVNLDADITNDVNIDLNSNTIAPTYSHKLSGGADLSMSNGTYVFENDVSFGHIDVRPGSTTDSTVSFEDMVFTSNKLNRTYGPCTDRVESVVEFTPNTGGKTTFLFKNCTFNNAQVVFEGLSGQVGYFTATFENCTFNNLGTSAGIDVQNYLEGSITVKDCTFNYTATASASAVSTSNSTVTINFEGTNAVVGTAATAYTHNSAIGEDETYDIKIMTPSVKVISVGSSTTVNGLDTVTVSGIATK